MAEIYENNKEEYDVETHLEYVKTLGRDSVMDYLGHWIEDVEKCEEEPWSEITEDYRLARISMVSDRMNEIMTEQGYPEHVPKSIEELLERKDYDKARRVLDEATYESKGFRENFKEKFDKFGL